ncbi:MAG TPA: zinc ribbon domain-containing protein [Methanofastidiosum sp.]|nr:zinc ribbon domain-containing protein [Methanofastidiosum sp.]
MPTYEYECKVCGHKFECFQKMSDETLKECPRCKGELRRLIFGGTGIIYKSKGFKKVDFRVEDEMKLVKKALLDERPITETEHEVAMEQLEKRCDRLGLDKETVMAEMHGAQRKKLTEKDKEERRKKALEQRKLIEKQGRS